MKTLTKNEKRKAANERGYNYTYSGNLKKGFFTPTDFGFKKSIHTIINQKNK